MKAVYTECVLKEYVSNSPLSNFHKTTYLLLTDMDSVGKLLNYCWNST